MGAARLGNPLNAMAWLVGELARPKRPLRAGDVVLSAPLPLATPSRRTRSEAERSIGSRKCLDRKLNLTVGKMKAAIPLFLLCSQQVMFASHEEK
jgi:hypothetical protein